ncbi:hypothetical protein Ahy_A10g048565 isoform C [Arachis hypogaea]|uniref:Uncharacterized protein n=1 Tax=Arachis hypogaea TaxID=3818 RepID=A0A445B5D9_ARAHY|nr:hypothetical protein Ahy_A10g048565 isoform C [Arachis hypogaea]
MDTTKLQKFSIAIRKLPA